MIEVDPEAVLELLDARDHYERERPGLGHVFELAAQRTLDAIAAAPERYPAHRFATTPGVRRARFPTPGACGHSSGSAAPRSLGVEIVSSRLTGGDGLSRLASTRAIVRIGDRWAVPVPAP